MKKLITIFAMILISLSSMSMGFPHNTYHQQKQLSKVNSTKTPTLSSIQDNLVSELEDVKIEEETKATSFIDMITNFIVRLFADEISSRKGLAFEKNINEKVILIALKKDFDDLGCVSA